MSTTRNSELKSRVRANEDGTYTFPLSSETPYRRWDGDEILVHTPDAVDLRFLKSGNAPLLDSHNREELESQLGVIVDAWLEEKRLYVTVKFSNRESAQEFKRDVDDGIIRNVSVGYDIHKVERDVDAESYRVIKWTPKEASFVSIPADETVGMGRSATAKEGRMDPIKQEKPSAGAMPGVRTDEERGAAMETAINEISALAATHNLGDVARDFIRGAVARGDEPSLAVFKGIVRAKLPEGTPLVNEDIGMTRRETQQFSLRKFLLATSNDASAQNVRDADFELKAVDAAGAARVGTFKLPAELMRSWTDFEVDGVRSSVLSGTRAAMGTSGNANVQATDHLANQFIYNLRNRLVLGQLGMTMLTGLDGNVDIPGGNANIAAAWLGSEDANAAESNPSFRKISLAIKDLAVYTDMTRRMLLQSTIDIEMYVRMQILDAMAQAIDTAGFYGSGTSGQPTGLKLTSGIGSVTFAAAIPTRSEVIDMRTAIASTNQTASPVYVGNSEMAGGLMKAKVDAGSGRFLMEAEGRLTTGNRFEETNQIVSGDLFAGVWSDMIMGTWGSLELDRSTEAKFLSGGLRLRAIQSVDFGVRRVGSFVLGNDGV